MLPLHVIKWMFFSSTPLSAEEAARYGFLNACAPPSRLPPISAVRLPVYAPL